MSRSKTLAVLQKTYDDSYLSCSTAVYHESQGNEIEAMRHWRGALDQIYEHNANKITPTYIPRSDTEKALIEALKQLELQCKERIDLLEALRVSRRDSPTTEPGGSGTKKQMSNNISDHPGKGSIGQGTIPAVTYSELSRPALLSRPSLPNRPSASSRTSLEAAHTTGNGYENEDLAAPSTSTPKSRSPARPAGPHAAGRALSPDKYTMRTTLRTGKSGEKAPRSSRKSPNPAAEGPSKAATLAWSSLSSREKPSRMAKPIFESPSSSQFRSQSSFDQAPNTTQRQWDSHSRRLVTPVNTNDLAADADSPSTRRDSDELAQPSHLSVSAASSALTSAQEVPPATSPSPRNNATRIGRSDPVPSRRSHDVSRRSSNGNSNTAPRGSITSPTEDTIKRKVVPRVKPKPRKLSANRPEIGPRARPRVTPTAPAAMATSSSEDDGGRDSSRRAPSKPGPARAVVRDETPEDFSADESVTEDILWKKKKETLLKNLPPGVDEPAARQILNDIIVQGDEVRWTDVAGLDVAKNALREAVVYPFLRPDLFMGLREPARGMLLFGPPGTGKTMLARAVATESKSTFFSISASSLTSKFLGESEKLVRALFGLAKVLAPSIIFVDEIDSLLSQRSGSGEHEATRRIKTEFLIQWSDLQRAAAGRETTDRDKERGDANRVLVLAATNLPWAIDEAARRRFVRRQYIPLPESTTRETQLKTLLAQQKHGLSEDDIATLVDLTEGFSGSDITALAKDAAMGPLRSLGDALLHMTMDDIRPIALSDFQLSLGSIRPSVSNAGLKEYEDWAKEFGERGG